jgi:rare lipoprotein A (peptidoglycan hydrolase)
MRSVLAALMLFLCACAFMGNATQTSAQNAPAVVKFAGLASVDDGRPTRFDGANYHGRVADGSRFKTAALAVAHRTLPLGSIVVVSYRGREARAVVNDRGPCLSSHCQRTAPARVRSRVLDMTPALARVLGFPGLGRVAFWPLTQP